MISLCFIIVMFWTAQRAGNWQCSWGSTCLQRLRCWWQTMGQGDWTWNGDYFHLLLLAGVRVCVWVSSSIVLLLNFAIYEGVYITLPTKLLQMGVCQLPPLIRLQRNSLLNPARESGEHCKHLWLWCLWLFLCSATDKVLPISLYGFGVCSTASTSRFM